jgi:excisionase family DNA binding protein
LRLKKEVAEIAPATSVAPRMLSVREAAVYLGATIWHVRSLVWAKKLTALHMGHRQVFDRADLDAFVERLKRGA